MNIQNMIDDFGELSTLDKKDKFISILYGFEEVHPVFHKLLEAVKDGSLEDKELISLYTDFLYFYQSMKNVTVHSYVKDSL